MNLSALQNSPFLQSLGWAIANSLWQAATLWIAYHIVNGAYKNASAKFKNNLSTVLLSSVFVWFCITLFTKYFAVENLSSNNTIQFYEVKNIDSAGGFKWHELVNKFTGTLPYLSIAYLLLLIFLSLRLVNVYRFTYFIKFNGLQKPDVEWKMFTEKVARHMGITRKIKLWVSHHIDVPATIGFIKPVILIPLASVNRLSPDQLEAIILHELSHIKRNDYLINLFVSIIETILFFNPFVVLLARIIKRERENCCDDFVIQYQYDRYDYASALLSLEQSRNIDLRLAIGATSGKKQLLLRIKRIMEINSNTNFNYGQKLVALLLITGVFCSVAWLSPENKESKKQKAENILAKVDDKKINQDEKSETFSVKQDDNKVKTISIKSLTKKECKQKEQQLKELQNLNLEVIADAEYKRVNGMLQESKKEISRKKGIKLNGNRFFMTAAGIGSNPAMFNKGMSFLPFNKAVANASVPRVYGVDFQKLQAEWDKAQFSLSFDCDQMQDAVKQVFNAKQLQPLLHLREKQKEADVEKMIKAELQRSTEKQLNRVQVFRVPRESDASNSRTYYFSDSTKTPEHRGTISRTKLAGTSYNESITDEDSYTPDQKQSSFAYNFSFGTNTNTVRLKRVLVKDINKTNVPEEKPTPVTPEVSDIIYRVVPGDNIPVKAKAPKPVRKDNTIRVEYKNGAVVINGKTIELPDTNEMLAQTQIIFKGKKIHSMAKELTKPHMED